MAQIDIEPLMVTGKTENGQEIEIDAALLLATDSAVRETFARGLQKLLDDGFHANYCISVAFILSDVFEEDPVITVFPQNHMETYLPEYAPGYEPEK